MKSFFSGIFCGLFLYLILSLCLKEGQLKSYKCYQRTDGYIMKIMVDIKFPNDTQFYPVIGGADIDSPSLLFHKYILNDVKEIECK